MLEQWLRLSNSQEDVYCRILNPVMTARGNRYTLYEATGPEEILQFYLLLVNNGNGKFDEAYFLNDESKLNIKNIDFTTMMRQMQNLGKKFDDIKVLSRSTKIESDKLVITYE